MAQQKIRARYTNGVFVPQEPVSLSEGCEVSVEAVESDDRVTSIDQYPEYVQRILRLQATWPRELREGPQTDWSVNHKRYLHGRPKEAEE